MIFRQSFEDIDRRRNRSALAIFHRLGQVHAVEQNITKLTRRSDIEFASCRFVNFVSLGPDLSLQLRRHLGERSGVYLHSRVFHARQHRNQRKINLFVELE